VVHPLLSAPVVGVVVAAAVEPMAVVVVAAAAVLLPRGMTDGLVEMFVLPATRSFRKRHESHDQSWP